MAFSTMSRLAPLFAMSNKQGKIGLSGQELDKLLNCSSLAKDFLFLQGPENLGV